MERPLIELIAEYIDTHGFDRPSIPYESIDTNTVIETSKGHGYCVNFKGYSSAMCVYMEPFEEMQRQGMPIQDIANQFMDLIAIKFNDVMDTANPIPDEIYKTFDASVGKRAIVTCHLATDTENTEANKGLDVIKKQNEELGITFFMKAQPAGFEDCDLYVPVTKQMLGREATPVDWELARFNTLLHSQICVQVQNAPAGMVTPFLMYDKAEFTDCFFFQMPLKPLARELGFKEILICPVNGYIANMYGIHEYVPDEITELWHNEVFDRLAERQFESQSKFETYIYNVVDDKITKYGGIIIV